MKFRQEFHISEPPGTVWRYIEQPLRVADCIPGVESAEEMDDGRLLVRATQKLGPLSTTFEAKIRITERIEEERIAFSSTGKAVRGAIGNFRSDNIVTLKANGGGTDIVVEGETALAGVLGTVGNSIVTKQANKVTAEFADNLERALSGDTAPEGASRPEQVAVTASPTAALRAAAQPPHDPWVKVAAVFSVAATIIGLIILIKGFR
jgi:carbon monoxide dehydrogenase subunit G